MATKISAEGERARWDTWANALLLVLFVFFFFNLWETVHERWVVERAPGPGGTVLIADYHVDFMVPVFVLLAVPVVIALFIRREKLWQFAHSLRLAIILLSSVLLATVLGTLVFQRANPSEYIEYYSEPLYAIFKAVHLTNVFRSWWFLMLLFLLAANLLACTLKRKPWSLPKLGFLLTHLGIVVTIIGAFIGGIFAFEGAIVLGEGESVGFIANEDYAKAFGINFEALNAEVIPEEYQVPLGAELKLYKFEEIHYEDPYIVSLTRIGTRQDQRTGEEALVIAPLQMIDFDDTKPITLKEDLGILQVKEIYRNLRREKLLEPDEAGKPLAKLVFKLDDSDSTVILGEETLNQPLDGLDSFKFRFSWTSPGDEELKKLGILSGVSPHMIRVYNRNREVIDEINLGVGQTSGIEDTDYSLEMLELFHDVKLPGEEGAAPENKSDFWNEPAAFVRVGGGDFDEPLTLLLPAYRPMPHDEAMMELIEKAGLVLSFVPGTPYEVLLIGETSTIRVFHGGDEVESFELDEGREYTPPLSRFSLALEGSLPKGRIKEEIYKDSPEENLAVRVEVRTGDRKREGVLEVADPAKIPLSVIRDDGRFALNLGEKTMVNLLVRNDYRKEWRAHVSLLSGEEKIRDHVIRVNEPLVHNNFYFYQQSFAPDLPYGETPSQWFTYLKVVNDPGLLVVYLGLGLIVVGLVYVFYVRPQLTRGRRKEENDYVD